LLERVWILAPELSQLFSVLVNRTYRHLFFAQVVALFGTGLMTVALALLAYDLAGADAGIVLGTALAIKMIVYVTLSPVAAGFAARFPRRGFLIFLDLVRATLALALPFVDAVWQIYVLIALLQSASAAFTPTFQATIPDILTDEDDYTNALSLSRLAYDLENLSEPDGRRDPCKCDRLSLALHLDLCRLPGIGCSCILHRPASHEGGTNRIPHKEDQKWGENLSQDTAIARLDGP
jgi:hypothetical protein